MINAFYIKWRKRLFVGHGCYAKNDPFHQDRLGTNMGKALKKEGVPPLSSCRSVAARSEGTLS
jgi:hypothetical protein